MIRSKKWHQNLTDKKRQLMLGLSTSTKALAIASSLRQEDKIVLLTSTYGEAEGLVSDLISILGEELVYPFLIDDSPMVEFFDVFTRKKSFHGLKPCVF